MSTIWFHLGVFQIGQSSYWFWGLQWVTKLTTAIIQPTKKSCSELKCEEQGKGQKNPNHIKIFKPIIQQGPKLSNLFLSLAKWGCGPPIVPIYSTSHALGSSESGTGYATCGILVTAEARVPLRLGVPYRPVYVSYVFRCIHMYSYVISYVSSITILQSKVSDG